MSRNASVEYACGFPAVEGSDFEEEMDMKRTALLCLALTLAASRLPPSAGGISFS
jgi:hypothetical protein